MSICTTQFAFIDKKNSKTSKKKKDPSKDSKQKREGLSLFNAEHYYVGSPIWTYQEDLNELGILCLPQSLNQRGCTTASPVKYMEDLGIVQ